MKITFIPGPWHIRNLRSEGHDIGFTDDLQIATVPDPAGFGIPIAMVSYHEKYQREANARLIAAAPDLLAALEAVTLAIEQLVNIRSGSPVAYSVRKARSAINKARGE